MSDSLVQDYLSRLNFAAESLPPSRRTELVAEIAGHIDQARASGQARGGSGMRHLLSCLGDPEEIVAAARDEQPEQAAGGSDAAGHPQRVGHRRTSNPGTGHPVTGRAGRHQSTGQPGSGRPGSGRPGTVRPGTGRPGTGRETAALLLLTLGSAVPFVGWFVGLMLLWTSQWIRLGEKILATLVIPGGPFLALFVGLTLAQSCSANTISDAAGSVARSQTCSSPQLPGWIGLPLFLIAVIAPFVIAAVLLRRVSARAKFSEPDPGGAAPIGPVTLMPPGRGASSD